MASNCVRKAAIFVLVNEDMIQFPNRGACNLEMQKRHCSFASLSPISVGVDKTEPGNTYTLKFACVV